MDVYIVNAFTEERFGGNPAAVVPLDAWPGDDDMQAVASQLNLSDTAFFLPYGDGYAIRWFTPTREAELCGHATLACGHVFFNHLKLTGKTVRLYSKGGTLEVTGQMNGKITLDFPAVQSTGIQSSDFLESCLRQIPAALYLSPLDYLAVFENQSDIEQLHPDFDLLAKVPARGLIATAPGDSCDFVSRCFYPHSGINEDPVTGSAHAIMTPYWSARLNKQVLSARQLSARKGYLDCEWREDRVLISGYARTFLVGKLTDFLANPSTGRLS